MGISENITSNGSMRREVPLEYFCSHLKLISNPNRVRILLHLRDGERAVGEMETALGLKQPNLSHELRKLRDHGLVTTRRQSKVIFYSIRDVSTLKFLEGLVEFRGKFDRSMREPTPVGRDNRPADGKGNRKTLSQENQENGECGQFAVVHPLNTTT